MTPKEQIQFKILRTIEQNPQTTQRELARMLGVSNGKAHYLIAALMGKGLLKIDSFSRNDGKAGKVAYLLTPEGIKNRAGLQERINALLTEGNSLHPTASPYPLKCNAFAPKKSNCNARP